MTSVGGRRSSEAIPGPRAPKAWQFLRFYLDPIGYSEACRARYGSTFVLRIFVFDKVVLATDPEDARAILVEDERFRGGEAVRRFIEPVAGTASVLTTAGATHMRQRKLILPVMHENLVERWAGRIEAIAEAELAQLPLGRPIAMLPTMQRIMLNVICQLLFGVDDPARLVELREALLKTLATRFGPLLFFPALLGNTSRLNPASQFLRRKAAVDRLIAEQIADRRKDPDLERRDDALSLLLRTRDEDGEPLSADELRDQLMTLLIAGHETTAAALTWALERLSRTPHANARLAEEIAAAKGDEYLDAVAQETLRLRPSIVDVPRKATIDTELGGYPIPAGTTVAAMLGVTQRRPDLWAEPLAFKPERFLAEDKPVPYSYTPFGGGVRRCIGASLAALEMRVVLRSVLRRFALAPAPGAVEKVRLTGALLTPSRGGRVVLGPPA